MRVGGRARAVRRNRARRRLRAAWSHVAPRGVDVIIQADESYADKEFQEVVNDVAEALARARPGAER